MMREAVFVKIRGARGGRGEGGGGLLRGMTGGQRGGQGGGEVLGACRAPKQVPFEEL